MYSSGRNVIYPATYDVQYIPPVSTRVVQIDNGDDFRRSTAYRSSSSFGSLGCLIGLIVCILAGVGLALALVFILRSNNNDDSTDNISTTKATLTITSTTVLTTTVTSTAITATVETMSSETVASTTTIPITATIRTPSGGSCYFGGDFVNLVDGRYRRIEHLQVGDRIWSLAIDGQTLIEDEMILMMHAESNSTSLFYTFITVDDHFLSLSGSHYIAVFDIKSNKTQYLPASKVTIEHQLIMPNRRVQINKITTSFLTGFYSPLTLTGNLLVNNISTSVYVNSYGEPPEILHRVFTPIRMYYGLMRWVFGNDHNPFETNIKYGLHPLPAFLKTNEPLIRFVFLIDKNINSIIIMILMMYLISKRQLIKLHFVPK